MKKLSIEEKSKRYDIALEKIKRLLGTGSSCSREELEYVFPELAESEDERIRKELIDFLEYYRLNNVLDSKTISLLTDSVAWLEKQGEHKKFRDSIQVGDKVTRNEDGVLVNLCQLKRVAKKDEKQGEQKPNCCNGQKPKTHNGSDNPYDMSYPDAEGYISKRGFDIPWRDCDVFVDYRYITQTVGNILRWADDNPKQKSTSLELKAGCWYLCIEDYQPRADYTDFYQGEKYHCEKDGVMGKWCIKHPEKYFRECKKPTEWSEEDKDMLYKVTAVINRLCAKGEEFIWSPKTLEKLFYWLQDLKPQSTWKPSDEMLEALYRVILENVMEKSEDEMLLDKLYQGLKYGKVLSEK